MDHDAHSFGGNPEEPMSFDDLEPFVHHCRGVDADLPAHVPGRMLQRLVFRRAPHLFSRGRPKGPAGSREPDSLDLVLPAREALVHRVVLAVDGKKADPDAATARVISSPAMTRVSLFARPTVFLSSIARSVGTNPAAPTVADITKSASGWVATAISPSLPVSDASAVIVAPNSPACSRRRVPFDPAARPTTFSLSGCARTTSSVLCPMDPVDPRMARFFRSCTSQTRSTPARRTTTRRCGRARRHDPG